MTLLPGDAISTARAGVGLGGNPSVYLQAGDLVELGLESLGESRQAVVAFPRCRMTQSAGNIFRFDGKTSVITGGGSGIGRAIALKFAAQAPKSIFLIAVRKMRRLPVSKSQRQEGPPAAIAAT